MAEPASLTEPSIQRGRAGVRGRVATVLLCVLVLMSGNPSSLAPWLGGYQSIVAMSLIAIVICSLMNKPRNGIKISGFLWVFLIYLSLSSYSSSNSRLTLYTAVIFALLALAVFMIARHLSAEEVGVSLIYVGVTALTASLILEIAAPGKALDAGMLSGIYSHKNILGFMLSIAFTANLYAFAFRKIWVKYAIGLFLLLGIYRTDSTTAMLACVFSAAIVSYLRLHSKIVSRSGRTVLTLTMLAFTAFVLDTILNESGTILSLLGKSPTLSARTGIWEFVTHLWLQQPWNGYGFGAVWSDGSPMRVFIQESLRNPAATHAHNGYLDVLLQTGIVGALTFFCLILSIFVKAWKTVGVTSQASSGLPFALISFMLFYNVAESRFYNPAGWAVIIIASICVNVMSAHKPKIRSKGVRITL